MYLPLDMPPMTDYQVQEYVIEYNSSLDFVDNMSDVSKRSYYMGTENYLNLNDEQFEYLETVYYPIFEEEERQEQERQEQKRQEELRQLEEQHQKELDEYRNIISQNPNVRLDDNTPQEDICHLGGGIVVKCSEFFDY